MFDHTKTPGKTAAIFWLFSSRISNWGKGSSDVSLGPIIISVSNFRFE